MSLACRGGQIAVVWSLVGWLSLIGSSASGQEDLFASRAAKRAYGPEQATGKPDVAQAGDNGNAWASRGADDADEWLVCEFEEAVMVKSISVYETYNPGALYKVSAFAADDVGDEEETVAWEGEDPTPQNEPKGISVIPVKLSFPVRKMKLYLDSPRVSGWNEIDAVAIEDTDGNRFWATRVEASTTYAERNSTAAAGKRNYGPEQATGEPDTRQAGDQLTAWASATPDGQKEWLICEFDRAQNPSEIVVHETYNPGAVYRVTVFDENDQEMLAWEGDDPTPRDQPRGVSVFPVELDFAFSKVKIYIDSPAVSGWNEIDAVGLRRNDGETQWCKEAMASSIFGVNTTQQSASARTNIVQTLKQFAGLPQEVQELRRQVEELKQLREEVKELKELLKKLVKE